MLYLAGNFLISMEQLIDFFIDPYRHTPAIYIILEFTAAFLGILSVWYAKKENILVYPVGIISTSIYVYLLSRWQLYGDLIINIYYTLMSIYGWYMWLKPVDKTHKERIITRANMRDWLITTAIFIVTAVFVLAVYRHYKVIPEFNGWTSFREYFLMHFKPDVKELQKITPFLDTFTTAAAMAAMWLMAMKKLENWHLWIALNIVSIPLYFIKGYGFTGIQYFIFLILAVQGLHEWKKRWKTESGKSLQTS